ncbi:MAG: flippase-like domain-containing protein [bacterium]|nr:flippase-like domain-containing protein [bacterium]
MLMDRYGRARLLLQVVLSVAIAVALLIKLDVRRFYYDLCTVSLPILPAIVLLLIPNVLLRSVRWRLLFDDRNHSISIGDSTRLLLVGMGLNLALPATSGDIVKCYFAYKWSGIKERMLSISMVDKILALASVALIGVPFACASGQVLYAGLAVVAVVPAAVLLLTPRLAAKVSLFRAVLRGATNAVGRKLDFFALVDDANIRRGKLIRALLLSVLGWACTYLQVYLCLGALHVEVSMAYVLSVAPLLTLVRLMPFTVSGIGSDEAAWYFVFRSVGASLEQVVASALLFRVLAIIVPGLVGLIVLAGTRRLAREEGSASGDGGGPREDFAA